MPGKVNCQETDGEGITHITVVGDFISVVLAYSVDCAYFVAVCVAIIDSVSYCGYCGRGVSCTAQGNPVFASEIAWASLKYFCHEDTKTLRFPFIFANLANNR